MPSSELRDELTATVLRLAKERFRRRARRCQPLHPSIEDNDGGLESDSRTHDDQEDEEEGEEAVDGDEEGEAASLPSSPPAMHASSDREAKTPPPSSSPVAAIEPEPAVEGLEAETSIDDDASHHLLRPMVRHVLSQLDRTLTILHNTRVAGLGALSDSDSSNTEDNHDNAESTDKRRQAARTAASSSLRPSAAPKTSTSRRGRPRKVHAPLDGETLEEMQIRVARQSHRRKPAQTTPDSPDKDAAFEAWLQEGDARMMRRRQEEEQQQQHEQHEQHDRARPTNPGKLRSWGLRDWSDVLGAAALAGFPEDVIARATRRCADLFRQGMTMRRLDEGPAPQANAAARGQSLGISTTEYRPERTPMPPSPADGFASFSLASSSSPPSPPSSSSSSFSDNDDDDNHDIDGDEDRGEETARVRRKGKKKAKRESLSQRRIASAFDSRSRSRSRSRAASSPSSAPQSRSSRSLSAGGVWFCPVSTCDRAANGFSRRYNLKRHMTLVHPGRRASVVEGTTNTVATSDKSAGGSGTEHQDWRPAADHHDNDDDDDGHDGSESEVVGAVHVDGFLKAIVPGRGWRGEDLQQRRRRKRRRESS